MHHNWVRIFVFSISAAFMAIALIIIQSPQSTSATTFTPSSPSVTFVESDSQCGTDTADDNGNAITGHDGVNEGCPQVGTASETGTQCENSTNDADGGTTDSAVNDGCPGLSRVGLNQTPDTSALFDIPLPSSQFGGAVAFTDADFTPAVGGAGGTMALGAIAGVVSSKATLGLANGACFTITPVELVMMNASTDITDTVAPDGPPENLLLPLTEDTNSNDLPDVVDKYPSYLNTLFDPDGPGGTAPLTPRARYVGVQDVAGLIVVLNLVVFDVGDVRNLPGGGGALASLGYPVATILQDPTQAPSNSPITDFCATLTTNIALFGESNDNDCSTASTKPAGCTTSVDVGGDLRTINRGVNGGDSNDTTPGEAGVTRLTGPTNPAGTAVNTGQTVSQRDFDNDNIENGLDPCHSSNSGAYDPRDPINSINNPGTDSDSDGLDVTCDSNDASFNSDDDGDSYLNRLDNCARVPNGDTKLDGNATIGDNFVTVLSTSGFTAGNSISIGSGNAAERGTNIVITSGTVLTFTLSGGLVNSHLSTEEVAQVFPANSNLGQADTDIPLPAPVPDGGPRSDTIGPECDTGVTIPPTPPGETLSPTVPNGHFHRATVVARTCALGTTATTTLSAAIDDSVTTIPVASTSGFPSSGIILIDLETITYTSTTATTFVGTIPAATRGEGTSTEASHADTTAVLQPRDDDGDGVCTGYIQIAALGAAETGTQCEDGSDNDADGVAGDGCAEDDTTNDTDGDGILDGVDNCLNTENIAPTGLTQRDEDMDGIGDACETVNSTTNTNDNDGDGFSNTLEGLLTTTSESGLSGLSQCGNATNDDAGDDGGTPRVNDGCPAWGAAETNCADAIDSDRDRYINDGCPAVNAAEGSSGISTAVEISCATNSQDTVGSFPPDVDGDGAVGSSDLSLIAGPIGTGTVAGGGATPDRRDIAPEPVSDNSITSADLGRVAAVIGTSC